jgi:uncharacterized protein
MAILKPSPSITHSNEPWWKFGHVWLVIAGPAIVVVASFTTYYLAAKSADPILSRELPQEQVQKNETQANSTQITPNMAPAMAARNHAATGVPSAVK